MFYRKFNELNLSQLGMGLMRLPKIEGKGEAIDEGKAQAIIEQAYENGVNYFDTAYRYHGGESERFAGRTLSQYKRDSFYLASKMPGHMMNYENGNYSFTGLLAKSPPRTPSEVFEEQLERCRVDYFDFYLLHNVSEGSYGFYTNEEIGVIPFLLEQMKKGRIRHLGFSAHGRPETIEKFILWSESRFPGGCFEIVQIQLNYLDWALQDAKRKYEILTDHKIRVIAMEPCRGGKLASFDDKAGENLNDLLKASRPNDSIASWAFRFAKALPNMQVFLSGMSSLEQLHDNLKTFSDSVVLTEEENKILQKVVAALANLIPCTACRYCSAECPQKLDIPKLISMHNAAANGDESIWGALGFTLNTMTEAELPSSCVDCGNCIQVCPQGIDVPDIMRKLAEGISNNVKPKL